MSDVFDRNLVLFIFMIVFFYMQFLSIQISSRTGWNNLTCNPLNLFTNSLFQSQEDANKDFEKCIVNLSAETTKDLFKKQVSNQIEVLSTLSGVTQDYSNLTKNVDGYKKDIRDTTAEYNGQIKGIQDSQNTVKELSTTTSGYVNNYIVKVQSIFNNIRSYFQK